MKFSVLRKYIDDSLKCLTTGRASGACIPRTKVDFESLVDLLRRKIHEPPHLPDPPSQPTLLTPPTEPAPFPPFRHSEELSELEAKHKFLEDELAAKSSDSIATSRSIRKLKQKITFTNDALIPLRSKEKADYETNKKEYYKEYLIALGAYKDAQRKWRKAVNRHKAKCAHILQQHDAQKQDRQKFVERIQRDVNKVFAFGTPVSVQRIGWRVLPGGQWSFDSILQHYKELARINRHITYDTERLERVFSLNPLTLYIGVDEFEGYIVFTFRQTKKVILECPVYGNAIYVINGDWHALSRLSKSELLHQHNDVVERIIHTGNWFSTLRRSIIYS